MSLLNHNFFNFATATALGFVGAGAAALWVVRRGLQTYKALRAGLQRNLGWVRNPLAREPEMIPVLSCEEAVAYFSAERPDDPTVETGAMRLQSGKDGYVFTQVYLDAHGEVVTDRHGVPLGRRVVAREVDAALRGLFEGREFVLLPGVSDQLDIEPDVPEVTLAEALRYFAERIPAGASVAKGAMILTRQGSGYLLRQVFLDGRYHLVCAPGGKPYGRQRGAKAIDDQLHQAFDGVSVVIVEPQEKAGGGARVVDILTYADAVKYFVAGRPDDKRVRKGAIRVLRHRKSCLVEQVFLNANNEPVCDPGGRVYGRRLVVGGIDAELREMFDGRELLIFE